MLDKKMIPKILILLAVLLAGSMIVTMAKLIGLPHMAQNLIWMIWGGIFMYIIFVWFKMGGKIKQEQEVDIKKFFKVTGIVLFSAFGIAILESINFSINFLRRGSFFMLSLVVVYFILIVSRETKKRIK